MSLSALQGSGAVISVCSQLSSGLNLWRRRSCSGGRPAPGMPSAPMWGSWKTKKKRFHFVIFTFAVTSMWLKCFTCGTSERQGKVSRAQATCSSFSARVTVQVLYTKTPPFFSSRTACRDTDSYVFMYSLYSRCNRGFINFLVSFRSTGPKLFGFSSFFAALF